jgi:hypothetical protein
MDIVGYISGGETRWKNDGLLRTPIDIAIRKFNRVTVPFMGYEKLEAKGWI